jgi:hypothetical protein
MSLAVLLVLSSQVLATKLASKADHIEAKQYGRYMLGVLQLKAGGGISEIVEAIDEIVDDLKRTQAEADDTNDRSKEV